MCVTMVVVGGRFSEALLDHVPERLRFEPGRHRRDRGRQRGRKSRGMYACMYVASW